jgi:hypothetical protein
MGLAEHMERGYNSRVSLRRDIPGPDYACPCCGERIWLYRGRTRSVETSALHHCYPTPVLTGRPEAMLEALRNLQGPTAGPKPTDLHEPTNVHPTPQPRPEPREETPAEDEGRRWVLYL